MEKKPLQNPWFQDGLGLTFQAFQRQGESMALIGEYETLKDLLADAINKKLPEDVVIYSYLDGDELDEITTIN